MKLVIKFGGYQEPASIHNRAAARFGQLVEERLGDDVAFELIGSILKLGRPSGDLVPMVERGELSFCYMSTVRFSGRRQSCGCSSYLSSSPNAAPPSAPWTASTARSPVSGSATRRPAASWATGTTASGIFRRACGRSAYPRIVAVSAFAPR
jgi:hypothetical protein